MCGNNLPGRQNYAIITKNICSFSTVKFVWLVTDIRVLRVMETSMKGLSRLQKTHAGRKVWSASATRHAFFHYYLCHLYGEGMEFIMSKTIRETMQVQNSELYYEVYGEGIPFLIIHGWGVDHRLMSGRMEPVFNQSGLKFQRIYIDLPGMGRSRAGGSVKNSDDMLKVLLAFVDMMLPNYPFVLAGESYGGYLARAMIQSRGEQILGLMLLCPAVYPGYRKGNVVPHTVLVRDEAFLNTLSEQDRIGFEFMQVVQTQKVWERYKADIYDAVNANSENYFLHHVLNAAFTYDIDKLQQPFSKPSLILVGRQDTEVGYSDQFKLLKNYPRASYAVLDKAGHNLQLEQEELFGSLMREWLVRVQAEAGNS